MIFAFGILLLIAFLVIFIKYKDHKLLKTVTNSNRGTKTERNLVLKLLKSGISEQTIFHDLYVKRYYGFYSQIDLVVATKVGIIVFEVKNYKGWIFGSGFNTNWTQVLAFGKIKYRFNNPILQNNKHIDDLKRQLNQFSKIKYLLLSNLYKMHLTIYKESYPFFLHNIFSFFYRLMQFYIFRCLTLKHP